MIFSLRDDWELRHLTQSRNNNMQWELSLCRKVYDCMLVTYCFGITYTTAIFSLLYISSIQGWVPITLSSSRTSTLKNMFNQQRGTNVYARVVCAYSCVCSYTCVCACAYVYVFVMVFMWGCMRISVYTIMLMRASSSAWIYYKPSSEVWELTHNLPASLLSKNWCEISCSMVWIDKSHFQKYFLRALICVCPFVWASACFNIKISQSCACL